MNIKMLCDFYIYIYTVPAAVMSTFMGPGSNTRLDLPFVCAAVVAPPGRDAVSAAPSRPPYMYLCSILTF